MKKLSYKKKFLTFFSGTIIAQIITIAAMPLLTRLYSTSDFGQYNLYLSLLAIFTVISTLRLEFAYNQAESNKEISGINRIIQFFSFYFSVILFLFLLILSKINFIDLSIYFSLLLTISIFFQSINYSQTYLLNKIDDFNSLTKGKINKSTVNVLSNAVIGKYKVIDSGLIISNIISLISSNYYQRRSINTKFKKEYLSKNELKEIFISYKDFPKYNIISSLFDTLALNLPFIIFTKFFGLATTGAYGIAYRTVSMPISLISQSIGQVFLNEISKKFKNGENIINVIYKVSFLLAIIGFIPSIFLARYSPELFTFIFGSEWIKSGQMLQIIIFSLYLKFIVSPITNIYFIINKMSTLFKLQMLRGISTFFILIIGCIYFDIFTVLIIYTIHECLFYILYYLNIVYICKSVYKNI
ncbi:hypothetical protein ETI03_01750 [Macrococcoides canis]|uniref:oligosaccharide flippase family protein n=1 Tax=Macrococcoides canis TaxID=1855823 RepID=UPI00105EE76A|nr:oligosaccharide flippase family protein [Macrococcus canis]TDM32444.1 hypothetical protein ETI03_01750 [Macrococcus canis]